MTKKPQHIIYTPAHIANFFLDQPNHNIDNLKLNKLVYIAFGWSYALLDRQIFNEPIQAWKFGPVIPSLYHEFKHFRYNVIDCFSVIEDIYFFGSQDKEITINLKVDEKDKELKNILLQVNHKYNKYTSLELVNLTHAKGTPWEKAYNGKGNYYNTEIPKEEIKNYYKSKIED